MRHRSSESFPPHFRIVVGTFGDESWRDLAVQRALPSAEAAATKSKYKASVVNVHAPTLGLARNFGGLGDDSSGWLIFLDADDTLDENYVEAMGDRICSLPNDGYIVQPSTCTVRKGVRVDKPSLIPPKQSILDGNHCVIGSAIHVDMFMAAGMFKEEPFWEDWTLWIRSWLEGAEFATCPEAIYEVWPTDNSRNKVSDMEARAMFKKVRARYAGVKRSKFT